MPAHRCAPFAGRRDSFAPRLDNPLAAMLRAVTYPAVPRGGGVLRLTLMAKHTPLQLRPAGEIISAAVLAGRDAEPDAAVA